MPKAVMVIFTKPSDWSREDEYNDWYENQHLPDVCSVPGVLSARRFLLSPAKIKDPTAVGPPPELPKYLALYEVEADDLQALMDELLRRAMEGEMVISEAFAHYDGLPSMTYEEISAYPASPDGRS